MIQISQFTDDDISVDHHTFIPAQFCRALLISVVLFRQELYHESH